MVDVTKENFEEQLARFREALLEPSLCFISFDFEFTGIAQPGTSFTEFNSYDDSPAERFAKLREVVLRYSICQLGVALFSRRSAESKEAEGLVCSVFNFNLFTTEDTTISASSMQFLARNGFDLNAWVLKGIPWMNAAERKHIMDGLERKVAELDREQAEEDEKSMSSAAGGEAAAGDAAGGAAGEPPAGENGMVLEKEADRATAADALGKLDDWLATCDGAEDASDEDPDSAPPELLLPSLEWAGLRRFVYREIEANPKYAHHGLITEKRGRSTIAVLRPSREQRRRRREAEKAKLSAEANRKVGAWFIFEAMSRACRGDEEGVGREPIPLVGHNCFADLAFLFSSFAVIPESYDAWKAAVHDAFPVILDTKHVAAFGASANWWQWSNTALESLHAELIPSTESKGASSSSSSSSSARSLHYLPPDPIEITFANDFDRYREGSEGVERFHEAGWDAYCTGCVLTRLAEKTLSWSALTTGTATRKKRSREEDDEDEDAAVVDDDCDTPSVETHQGDRKRRKAHGGKVSVASITKPSDDSLVSISAVSAMSQLISPRKMPRKREKSSAPEVVAPVGQYGILCELPFNELNLMRSPHVIKLGEVSDIKRDGSATATSAPRSGETKVFGGAVSEKKQAEKKSGIGSRLKKALGLSGKSLKSGAAGATGADAAPQDGSAQEAPAPAPAMQDDPKDEKSDEKGKEPQCTIVSY